VRFRNAAAAKSSEEKQANWTDSVPTDKAVCVSDERLRALPMLFSEPVATHRQLHRYKPRYLVDRNRFLINQSTGRTAWAFHIIVDTVLVIPQSFSVIFQAGGKFRDFTRASLTYLFTVAQPQNAIFSYLAYAMLAICILQ
jgi:hypothetical protein